MKTRNLLIGLVFLVLLVGGASAVSSTISATYGAINPADNAWDNDLIVTFNCSATPVNATVANISIYVDSILNKTLTIGGAINTTSYANFTVTFPADSCTGRTYFCQAWNNESVDANSTARTIKLDATSPTVSCDRGSDYFTVERGDIIAFTSADNCAIASRLWTKDDGTTTSSSFVITDDIDTAGWERSAYDVNETVTDSAGNTGTGTCYISAMSKRTPGKTITIHTAEPITVEDGQLKIGEEKDKLAESAPIVIIVLILGFLILKPGKSPRKKGRKR